MNIGFSINDAGLVVVVLLSMLLVPFALAMIGGLLARLLRLSGDFALLFTVGGAVVACWLVVRSGSTRLDTQCRA